MLEIVTGFRTTPAIMSKVKKFLKLKDKKYHIFANYCQEDYSVVRQLLQYLENYDFLINDPERDSMPGQSILREWIESGMEQSKVTVLFISKRFLTDELCVYMANLAVWKYITTKGKHRVFPVILETCAVPRSLRVFNCIHLWKYALPKKKHTESRNLVYNTQVTQRLVKAVTEPPPKFRRIHWNGTKTLTWTKQLVEKVKKSALKDKASKTAITRINPFQLFRLGKVLDHCYINCRYSHCTFACSGKNFNMFLSHVNKCRYRPVKCPNHGCFSYQPQWALDRHLDECPFLKITCPSNGCGVKLLRNNLYQHLTQCPQYKFHCQYYKNGCKEQLTYGDVDVHTENCPFATFPCEKCGVFLQKNVMKEHKNHCMKEEISCKLCRKKMLREDEVRHPNDCLMRKVECSGCLQEMERYRFLQHRSVCLGRIICCPNVRHGCDFTDKQVSMNIHETNCPFRQSQCDLCGTMLKFKDFNDHRMTCQSKRTCESCGMTVSRYAWKTHEKTCPRKNWQSYCGICHKFVENENIKEHRESLCMDLSTSSHQHVSMGSAGCSLQVTEASRPLMSSGDITNEECDTLYKRHNSTSRNNSSSDEQETESMEAFVASIMASTDSCATPVTKSYDNRTGSSHIKHCAQSRRKFNIILSAASKYNIKDILRPKY